MLITSIGVHEEHIEVKPTISENNMVTSLIHWGSIVSSESIYDIIKIMY